MYINGKIDVDVLFNTYYEYEEALHDWNEIADKKPKPIWIDWLPDDEKKVYRRMEEREQRFQIVCELTGIDEGKIAAAYRECENECWENGVEERAVKKHFGKTPTQER